MKRITVRRVRVELEVEMSREDETQRWQLDETASYLYRRVEGQAQEQLEAEGVGDA